ncbi:hypothetical protein PFMC_01082 [Plasmodium falciparum CAMP/Malaysia]|uniref:S1 motif domain-containing protein n=1 Tax=Plasmodium falciparum (isolate Camp / Malaysia) TaxID=5835 RepID=A0A024XC97_PLAFC|nr:hypothetical protein PFMC_01082 [Plasmodium falciparum CAMP/Malaysia]
MFLIWRLYKTLFLILYIIILQEYVCHSSNHIKSVNRCFIPFISEYIYKQKNRKNNISYDSSNSHYNDKIIPCGNYNKQLKYKINFCRNLYFNNKNEYNRICSRNKLNFHNIQTDNTIYKPKKKYYEVGKVREKIKMYTLFKDDKINTLKCNEEESVTSETINKHDSSVKVKGRRKKNITSNENIMNPNNKSVSSINTNLSDSSNNKNDNSLNSKKNDNTLNSKKNDNTLNSKKNDNTLNSKNNNNSLNSKNNNNSLNSKKSNNSYNDKHIDHIIPEGKNKINNNIDVKHNINNKLNEINEEPYEDTHNKEENSSNKNDNDEKRKEENNNITRRYIKNDQMSYNNINTNSNEYDKNASTLDETYIGKTFEGYVYSVNKNAACIKLKNINKYGLLFKNKANLGDDIEDMNDFFEKDQPVHVKILGINTKKNIFYLGNIIKYNENIKLSKGEYSKGLITKVCDSYCFIKVLKNGSTGYLHKSKLFCMNDKEKKNNDNQNYDNPNNDNPNYDNQNYDNQNYNNPNYDHPNYDNQNYDNQNYNNPNNDYSTSQLYNSDNLQMDFIYKLQFTKIFNIWDIIDVEILGTPQNDYKSNYILTIPRGSKTFKKILNYLNVLKENEDINNIQYKGDYIYSIDNNKNDNIIDSDINNHHINNKKKKKNLYDIQNNMNHSPFNKFHTEDEYLFNDHVQENVHTFYEKNKKYKITYDKENNHKMNKSYYLKKNKELPFNNKFKKIIKNIYDLPNTISLSMLSKTIKIPLASIKKYFIIHENKEYNSSYKINSEQIKRICQHFKIDCNVEQRDDNVVTKVNGTTKDCQEKVFKNVTQDRLKEGEQERVIKVEAKIKNDEMVMQEQKDTKEEKHMDVQFIEEKDINVQDINVQDIY